MYETRNETDCCLATVGRGRSRRPEACQGPGPISVQSPYGLDREEAGGHSCRSSLAASVVSGWSRRRRRRRGVRQATPSPNPAVTTTAILRAAGECAVIICRLFKECPKLRPCPRLSTVFSLAPNDTCPFAHLPQRVVPDIQHPFTWDNSPAFIHREVVEYSKSPIHQAEIQFGLLLDILNLFDAVDQPSPSMQIFGHERAVNFPIGGALLLSPLQEYSYE